MNNWDNRLCGGTFFTLLLQNKRQQTPKQLGKKSDYTEADILRDLILIVDSSFKIKNNESFGKTVSLYQSCKIKKSDVIPITGVIVVNAFEECINTKYPALLVKMEKLTNDYIDIGDENTKGVWFVKQLLELIENDESIEEDMNFNIYKDGTAIKKRALKELNDFYLPSFLLGIWCFIVLNRPDNTAGKDTFDSWHRKSDRPNTKPKFISQIGKGIRHPIRLIMSNSKVLNVEENSVERDKPLLEGDERFFESTASVDTTEKQTVGTDPKSVRVNNYGTVENQKFITIETMNGDIHL